MKQPKNINRGIFAKDQYTKYVEFSKAVLWKDKELSLPKYIIAGFAAHNTKRVVFIDTHKKEKWIFHAIDIISFGKLKTVGQEEQVYFRIDMAEKEEVFKEISGRPLDK